MTPAILGGVVLAAFLAFCYWRILSRLGLPGWAALLIFIPFVGQIALVAWLAFGRWPAVDGRYGGPRGYR